MCIVCVKPADLVLSQETINNMWNRNSDGAGFMFAENGKLIIQKGFMTLEAFKEAYKEHEKKQVVLHFRIKTHGKIDEVNTHPFQIDEDLAFVHNGMISSYGSNDKSDTWHFNEELIKPLRKDIKSFLHIAPITELITNRIGYSKLVFLDSSGEVTIFNEEKGNRSLEGIWFSNTSWESPPVYEPKKTSGISSSVTSIGSRKSDAFELEESVLLLDEHYGTPKYSLGKVSWFSQGTHVAVLFGEKHKYIPPGKLVKVYSGTMTKRVGHFKVGDVVYRLDIDNTNKAITKIFQVGADKLHWIKSDCFLEDEPDEDFVFYDGGGNRSIFEGMSI